MPSIVVLGDRGPTTYLVINQLSRVFDIELVIFEHQPRSKKLRMLQRRRQRLGLWRVTQQSLFMAWDRLYIRPDALDRFGTRLEQRFTAAEIREMMEQAGLDRIQFSEFPYWCAVGYRL